MLDSDLRVVTANDSFYKTFQATPKATEGESHLRSGKRSMEYPEAADVLDEVLSSDTPLLKFRGRARFPADRPQDDAAAGAVISQPQGRRSPDSPLDSGRDRAARSRTRGIAFRRDVRAPDAGAGRGAQARGPRTSRQHGAVLGGLDDEHEPAEPDASEIRPQDSGDAGGKPVIWRMKAFAKFAPSPTCSIRRCWKTRGWLRRCAGSSRASGTAAESQ